MNYIFDKMNDLIENKIIDTNDRLSIINEVIPYWTWLNENQLFESVENDEYVNAYCRYITDKIVNEIKSYLIKNEIDLLSTKSYDELHNKISIDLRNRISDNIIEFTNLDKDKENIFKYFYIKFSPKKSDTLQALHPLMPKNIVMVELYILNEDGTIDAGNLKKIVIEKSNLDHELTHVLDINKNDSLMNNLKNMNIKKYNMFQQYYCNNAYEYHAFTNQVISKLNDEWNENPNTILKFIKTRNFKDFEDKLKSIMGENFKFFFYLNKRNKKNFISRIMNYFYDKAYKQQLLDLPKYNEKVEYQRDKNGKILFDEEDLELYSNLLFECLKENA